MIQCPKCGAAYTVLPDVCEKCKTHFVPTDGIPDPFVAALLQEQRSRAQQHELREAYLKRRNEQHAELQPEHQPQTEPQQKQSAKNSKSKKKTNRSVIIIWIAVFLVIGLFIIAFFDLWGGVKQNQSKSNHYAFYRQDSTLWFYRDDTREKHLLTSDCNPSDVLPESYLEKMTQIRADGSRVYYPLHFSEDQCQIACRTLSEPEKETVLIEIPLQPNASSSIIQTGRLNEREAFQFTDMMPPYIVKGDTVFYVNSDYALCRKVADRDAEVLAENVIRYWQISGKAGIYYLAPVDHTESSQTQHTVTKTTPLKSTPWSIIEDNMEPCNLYYCPTSGESESAYPEHMIESWAVPYADSDRYFYFWCRSRDNGTSLFFQADLLQGFCNLIEVSENEWSHSTLLCAYPDGSFYYTTDLSPRHSPTENTFLHFFNRKHARDYELCSLSNDRHYFSTVDICRTEPYAVVNIHPFEPMLFYCEKAVEVTMPSSGALFYTITATFDTQYPMLYLKASDHSAMLTSSHVDVVITDLEDATCLLYAMPDKEAPVTFQQSPYQLTNNMYFAIYIPDAVTPEQELLCWNRANNQLLQSNTELGIYDTILRKEDGLFFHSASENAIYGYRNHQFQKLSAENSKIHHYSWKPLTADSFFAIDATKTLTLYLPHSSITIDTADMLFSVGQMPGTSADK